MLRGTVNFLGRIGYKNLKYRVLRVIGKAKSKETEKQQSAEPRCIGHVTGDFSGALIFAKETTQENESQGAR